MSKKVLTPFIATHPGEMIKDELKERGMTQKQLADETGIKASVLSETINGKRSVSLNVAVALEKALGIPADIWMNMHKHSMTSIQSISLNVITSEKQSRLQSLFVTGICYKNSSVNSDGHVYSDTNNIIL